MTPTSVRDQELAPAATSESAPVAGSFAGLALGSLVVVVLPASLDGGTSGEGPSRRPPHRPGLPPTSLPTPATPSTPATPVNSSEGSSTAGFHHTCPVIGAGTEIARSCACPWTTVTSAGSTSGTTSVRPNLKTPETGVADTGCQQLHRVPPQPGSGWAGSAGSVGDQRDRQVVADEAQHGADVEDLVEAEPGGGGVGALAGVDQSSDAVADAATPPCRTASAPARPARCRPPGPTVRSRCAASREAAA